MTTETTTPDAARMREALEEAKYVLQYIYKPELPPLDGDNRLISATVGKINAALSAPPRNCDVYTTTDEARWAYHMHGDGLMTMQAFCDWFLAPAKEGGNDE